MYAACSAAGVPAAYWRTPTPEVDTSPLMGKWAWKSTTCRSWNIALPSTIRADGIIWQQHEDWARRTRRLWHSPPGGFAQHSGCRSCLALRWSARRDATGRREMAHSALDLGPGRDFETARPGG